MNTLEITFYEYPTEEIIQLAFELTKREDIGVSIAGLPEIMEELRGHPDHPTPKFVATKTIRRTHCGNTTVETSVN